LEKAPEIELIKMEFFKIIDVSITQEQLTELLTFKNLESLSSQLFPIAKPETNHVEIGSLWGAFSLFRHEIKGGVRFALLECPNALTWTITTGYEPAPESVVIHLTINRKEITQDFLEEIEEFLDDHVECLVRFFPIHCKG
jgi:hypothetical protein